MREKVLVTGGNGQLATCIKEGINHYFFKHDIQFKDVDEIDITNKESLYNSLNEIKPTIIINCAAYTDVERAEMDNNTPYLVNCIGCENLAEWCKDNNGLLIHISTDYVFDGSMNYPYKENNPRVPKNAYGYTKSQGEDKIMKSNCKYIILRTSWLYSRHGNNFFNKMISKILNHNTNTLYAPIDEVSVPTNSRNLSDAILRICSEYSENENKEKLHGVYHYVDNGVASRYDFLTAIYEYVKEKYPCSCNITPCYSDKFPSEVKRPKYSVLDNKKVTDTFKTVSTKDWRLSVKNEIKEMFKEYYS